jgi:hypothetical protein
VQINEGEESPFESDPDFSVNSHSSDNDDNQVDTFDID